MIQAFLVDTTTGVTVQRLRAPTLDGLADFPLAAGQTIVPFPLDVDIETVETWADDEAIYVRPRTPDPAEALAIARLQRWEAAKLIRDAHIDSGCMTPLGRVDSDEASRLNISGAVQAALIAQAAGESFAIDWTMADNSVVSHNGSAMVAMGLAVASYVSACHEAARLLRVAIEDAADLAAVEAIDIEVGWP